MKGFGLAILLVMAFAGCGGGAKTARDSSLLPRASGQFAPKSISSIQGQSSLLSTGRRMFHGNVKFVLPHSRVSGTARLMYQNPDGRTVFVPGKDGLHVETRSGGQSSIFVEDGPPTHVRPA